MKTSALFKSVLSIGCLVIVCGAVQARAEEPVIRNGYVDEDGDGICDKRYSKCEQECYQFADDNGDGICDNRAEQCIGTGYQNVNEGGVCGYYGSGERHMQRHGRK